MSKCPPVPALDVAVALLRFGDKILLVHNPVWGAFSLPMTKRRERADPSIRDSKTSESWSDAAVRAAAEALGRTLVMQPTEVLDLPDYEMSDRDDVWKRYHYKVFEFRFEKEQPLARSVAGELLTRQQALDPQRKPISVSARAILERLT
jgi:ADP-ribose pyrophosphatase YjhB (NUDIX family)